MIEGTQHGPSIARPGIVGNRNARRPCAIPVRVPVHRVAACLGSALLAWGCAQRIQAPPNFLLVTVDTLRADWLVCYGGAPDVGRAICALADNGTRFRWAFATAPATAPSIASVLTGRYPSFHAVTQSMYSTLAFGAVTVAELLKENGYTFFD